MSRIRSRTLVASAAAALVAVFAGAEAFGALPLGGTAPALSPTPNLSGTVSSLPHVSTPSAPSVSAPSSSVPSSPSPSGVRSLVGRIGGSAGGAVRGASGVAALVPRAAAGSTAGGSTTGAAGSRAAAVSAGSGGGSGSNGGSGRSADRGGSESHTTVPPEYRGRAGERRLRADVRRFASCLGALPALERRVLAARAGIGTAALSRSDAAEHLHISRDRELAVEGRGIEDLKSAARAGGCAAESGPATLGARGGLIASHLGAVPGLQPPMLLAGRPALETTVALAGPSARPLSGVEAASASGGSSTLASGATQLAGTQPSVGDPQYLFVLLAAALLLGAVALLRRTRESRAAYAAGDGPSDSPPLLEGPAPTPGDGAKEPPPVSWTRPGELGPAGTNERGAAAPRNGAGSAGARRAAVIAAGLASLAITGLLRRRR